MLRFSLPLCVFFLTLLLSSAATASAGQVTAYIYHRFDESRYPSTNISSDIFDQQLAYLKQQDYQVITLGELARRLNAGEPLPEKGAALSVDDAFTSFLEVGMPIIRKYGYPVTLFVNTDSVGGDGYLDWAQLRQLSAEGVEIANHTATHDYLVDVRPGESAAAWRERVKVDIARATARLEDELGPIPPIFAYPYGEYSPELVDIVASLGFDAAFAQQSGVIRTDSPRYFLPRFPMGGPYATVEGFKTKLAMAPLRIVEELPVSPVVTDNPPQLKVRIAASGTLGPINCFVQGENSCQVEVLLDEPGCYRVSADKPLAGRRNKYTLTAQDELGRWHWYSHLWINSAAAQVHPQ